jgi:hypothetical protein
LKSVVNTYSIYEGILPAFITSASFESLNNMAGSEMKGATRPEPWNVTLELHATDRGMMKLDENERKRGDICLSAALFVAHPI